ncbi:MAG: GTPase Era [Spirochaetes bacterium]|nr:GTPase Era [Spirochaetota bacterium]
MDTDCFKSGFVSLIGRPSSGKSSLINLICGYKISIVSAHPQTTQSVIRAVYSDNEAQIIFLDTPGYHNFNSILNKGLSNLAKKTLEDGDIVLYIIDITRYFGKEEEEIIEILKRTDKPIIAVFNKIDKKNEQSEIIKKEIRIRLNFINEIEISVLKKSNIDLLLEIVKNNLPYGPRYYDDDVVTDQSIPFRIKEIVREKVANNTKNEVPHSVYIDIFDLKTTEELITAHATIFVEKNSQKIILIGKKGNMIKKIGEDSRKDLMNIFERRVNLFLNVKIHNNWKKNIKFLKKRYEIDEL